MESIKIASVTISVILFANAFPVFFIVGSGIIFGIASFLRSISSYKKDFLWNFSAGFFKSFRERLISSELMSTVVVIDNKSYLRIPYIHDNFQRYVMMLPVTKNKLGKSYKLVVEKNIKKYVGPTGDVFHGIPTTPRMLCCDELEITYGNPNVCDRLTSVYKADEIILTTRRKVHDSPAIDLDDILSSLLLETETNCNQLSGISI